MAKRAAAAPLMSRRPPTFRQRDLTAAVKGAIAAGCAVERIEVGKDGFIVVQHRQSLLSIAPVTIKRERCDRPADQLPRLLSKENEAAVCEQLGSGRVLPDSTAPSGDQNRIHSRRLDAAWAHC